MKNVKKNNKNIISIKQKLYRAFIIIFLLGMVTNILSLMFLYITNSEYRFVLNTYGLSQREIGELSKENKKSKSIIRDIIFFYFSWKNVLPNTIFLRRKKNEEKNE